MSSRYQRGSLRRERGRWILRRRLEGRETRLVVGLAADLRTRASARREADAKLDALNAGARSEGERITLRRYAPFFLEEVCAQKKPSSRAGYTSAFEQHLLPAFGAKALADIGPREFTHLVAKLERAELKPRTVRAVVTVLAIALRKAADHGYAARAPDLRGLRLGAKRIVQAPRRAFTLAEIARILAAAAFPWRALYALLAFTGLRCGEALGLPWRAIDFETGQLVLEQAASMGRIQSTKSSGSAAQRPVHEQLLEILGEFRTWCMQMAFERDGASALPQPEELLFPSPLDPSRPRWSSGVRRAHFAPLLHELGIAPAGLHAFRHSYAMGLFNLGCSAPVVQQMLRHSDIKTTLLYTHVTPQDQRNASEAWARAIAEASA
ncbi:MAG: tyrosine-type recombinase/integrase [Terriglobales bacterium]